MAEIAWCTIISDIYKRKDTTSRTHACQRRTRCKFPSRVERSKGHGAASMEIVQGADFRPQFFSSLFFSLSFNCINYIILATSLYSSSSSGSATFRPCARVDRCFNLRKRRSVWKRRTLCGLVGFLFVLSFSSSWCIIQFDRMVYMLSESRSSRVIHEWKKFSRFRGP